EGLEERDSTFIQLVVEGQSEEPDEDLWQAFLDAYPYHYAARIAMAEIGVGATNLQERIALFDNALAMAPDAVAGHIVKIRFLHDEREWELARKAIFEGLVHNPNAPAILVEQGRHYLYQGQWDLSRQAFTNAIAQRSSWDARLGLAYALQMLGDIPGAESQMAVIYSDATPIDERIRITRRQALHLNGQGRLKEARQRLVECQQLAESNKQYEELVTCADSAVEMEYLNESCVEGQMAHTAIERSAAHAETPDILRRHVVSSSSAVAGFFAAHCGEVDFARNHLERFVDNPKDEMIWSNKDDVIWWIQLAIALASGESDEDLFDEPPEDISECGLAYYEARWLDRIGDPSAKQAYGALDAGICIAIGGERYYEA
ncbi:MAG: tetratricopeptide repeat protein, partial [Proteobacteria bacterium]|nr:tetratricopeptide repeat protein [Pseudomonadota bacterium]